MKKFMLTLIVVLPIAIVFFVAFTAAAIIKEIQFYNIQFVDIDWNSVGTNGRNPRIAIKRGESFDFFREGLIKVYPAKAEVTDIKFSIANIEENRSAQDILEIDGGKIIAKTNLSDQYKDGILIIMSNKDGTLIKERTTGSEVPYIRIDVQFTQGDPLDFAKYDIDYLVNKSLLNSPWQKAVTIKDDALAISPINMPDPDKEGYINILSAIVVAPKDYKILENFSFSSSDTNIVDIIIDPNNGSFLLDVKDYGQAELTFTITVPNIEDGIRTDTLKIDVFRQPRV